MKAFEIPPFGMNPMATVTPTQPILSLPLPSPEMVYRFTVEQFDGMVRSGFLDEDDPVELMNGILVTKMPKNPRHTVATRKAVRALQGVIPTGWFVQKEDSLVISAVSKWEPDVAVVRSELEFNSARDATASDCCLIVEVADSNLFQSALRETSRLRRGWHPDLLDRQSGGGNITGLGPRRALFRSGPGHGPVSISVGPPQRRRRSGRR